jgi:hypothetical protein
MLGGRAATTAAAWRHSACGGVRREQGWGRDRDGITRRDMHAADTGCHVVKAWDQDGHAGPGPTSGEAEMACTPARRAHERMLWSAAMATPATSLIS